ncbi:T9SS type A sorting domain-containing protein [Pontibacter roseus]|uniref:T9SS type A sorting domain-containing protein n=1 Tax=Pontibacter roseus TaxID=336989 RepID=UPI00036C0F11|nr:T9SS type A sorting domain-containing protein [Pontibacter roseus]
MKNTATLILIFCLTLSFELAAQFTSVTDLEPLEAQAYATREKQQAKVFTYDDKHWSILANTDGTHLWQLEGTSWKHVLKLVTRNSLADYVIDGNLVHILLFSGTSSQFISVEYDKSNSTFKHVQGENAAVGITLEEGVALASMDMDKTRRLWIASNGASGDINVRWSDSPYSNWSSPITIASGVRGDDMSAVISMPQSSRIGVLWSNQNTKRWGFKTHLDGKSPSDWTADEVPASSSALGIGSGMADDHINMKVASDGTLYCAIKTGYNTKGYPLIGLLVRRPSGEWDKLYEVSQSGTLPIILLNEKIGKIRIVYTSQTYGGDIVYKESLLSSISFCKKYSLMSGFFNYATTTKKSTDNEAVILASNETNVVGVLATDDPSNTDPPLACTGDDGESEDKLFIAYPNPFSFTTTINFVIPEDDNYSLTLYDSKGARIAVIKEGSAVAGVLNTISLERFAFTKGLYLLKLQTNNRDRSIKLVHEL